MIFISPQQNKWHEVYQRLKSHWEKEIRTGNPPPIALILNGWAYSNDADKKERWEMTLQWAEERNCNDLIPELKEEEKYYVSELSSYRPYEFYSLDEKYKPTQEEVIKALDTLKEKWNSVLDNDFFQNTRPVSFSGNKSRSLMVFYKSGYLPPWGSWTNHLANGRPSNFTLLRSNVNKFISPLGVDHIDFKEEDKA